MVKLELIDSKYIDRAWKEGASELGEACKLVDEITSDQLKLILSRGERGLVKLLRDDKTVGWSVFRVDQLPNMRVFYITDLVGKNSVFEEFFQAVKLMAEQLGCSRVRCAAHDAQARLYRIKLGFKPVYTTLEVEL
jgi:hypothetical protein